MLKRSGWGPPESALESPYLDETATLVQSPGGGSAPKTPAFALDEFFCFSDAVLEPGTAVPSEAEEIAAIKEGSWKPRRADFSAICERSNHFIKPGPDAVVQTFEDFLKILARPIRRINFVTYGSTFGSDSTIAFSVQIENSGTSANIPNPLPKPKTFSLSAKTLLAIREMLSLSNQPFRGLLAPIWNQPGREQRELWWYQVDFAADANLMRALASLLGITIFIFQKPLQFVPDFQVSPPRIVVRGQVGLGFDRNEAMARPLVKDLHKLDPQGIRLDP